jgi:hypothetical protein
MNPQQLEYNAQLRIKFASMDNNGALHTDAGAEYIALFRNKNMEGGWTATQTKGIIPKNARNTHRTWILSHDKIRIVAVDHETGIEFLYDPIKDIAVGVTTAAITSIMTWMWSKWNASRRLDKKPESSYVREIITETLPEGGSRKIIREEFRGPVSTKKVREYTANALAELSK